MNGSDKIPPIPTFFNLYASYEPTAVRISNGKRYGWVCLRDMNPLQGFVQRINGSKLGDGDEWKAVSDYDPTVVPAKNREEVKIDPKTGDAGTG